MTAWQLGQRNRVCSIAQGRSPGRAKSCVRPPRSKIVLVVGGGEGREEGGEFEDFDVGRVVGPVVAPADDDVAAVERVAVIAEAAALKFKFEMDTLPATGADLALGFAVGKARLHGFDDVAEFFGDHAEEKDDALFVDRFVAQAAKVEGGAVDGPIL